MTTFWMAISRLGLVLCAFLRLPVRSGKDAIVPDGGIMVKSGDNRGRREESKVFFDRVPLNQPSKKVCRDSISWVSAAHSCVLADMARRYSGQRLAPKVRGFKREASKNEYCMGEICNLGRQARIDKVSCRPRPGEGSGLVLAREDTCTKGVLQDVYGDGESAQKE